MKIAGKVIQDRNIKINSNEQFIATYKGKEIEIQAFYGGTKYNHLIGFDIEVYDLKSGMKDVETYQELHTMRDAIIYALKGSCLI
jgi:hypothetical protein